MPAAEVDITADLVRALLAGQHPDLATLPVRFLANGWDNASWRLGDDRLVRLPRRELGARIIAHEQRWLPQLAGRLPIQIPSPERTGHPANGYPYSWSVVPYIPGVPAADLAGSLDLATVATQLGRFLAALHVPAPPDAPANPMRGIPLRERAESFEASLEILSGQVDADAVRLVWDDALAAPEHDGPPLWLHGDLHPANILIQDGVVSGVIDFGDITAGDPACDLSVMWMLLPAGCHEQFRAAYGGIDESLRRRARGWALALAVVFLAHSAGSPWLVRVGSETLNALVG